MCTPPLSSEATTLFALTGFIACVSQKQIDFLDCVVTGDTHHALFVHALLIFLAIFVVRGSIL